MAGISGGGWMATVYPALDDRITYSFSVAGSFPFYLRALPTENVFRDRGDWEQHFTRFYENANYFDLYLLGGLGGARRQTLIYNAWDPCCFSGARAMTFLPHLHQKAKDMGINLDYVIDKTHYKHDISETAISTLLSGIFGDTIDKLP